MEIGADNILLTNMSELSQNTCWKVICEIFVSVIYNFIFKYNLTTTGRLENESEKRSQSGNLLSYSYKLCEI